MGTPYAVDIVFQAIDQSQRGTSSFLRQIEQVDSAIKRTTATAGVGAGGAAAGGPTSSVDRLFTGLTQRTLAVAGLRMGIDAVTVGFKIWQYESMKLKAPLDEVLRKHIEINEATSHIVRDIPFIGRAAARMMEAFGNTAGLKHVVSLLDEVRKSTERTFESIRKGVYDIRRMQLENIGAPGSAIKAVDIEAQRAGRKEELAALEKEVEKGREAVRLKREMEGEGEPRPPLSPSGLYPAYYNPAAAAQARDRTESERAKKEILGPAQEALRKKQAEDAQRRIEEEKTLARMRKEEGEKTFNKNIELLHKGMEEKRKEIMEERDQMQSVERLRANLIKDRGAREKEQIDIKYKFEIQRAKDAGKSIAMLEEMRRLELLGIEPEKRTPTRPGKTPAEDVRFMSGAYGYGIEYNPVVDMFRNTKTQVDVLNKILRTQEQILLHMRSQPTTQLRFSNFY